MRKFLHLRNAQQAHQALMSLWADAKPWLIAGHGLEVRISPERRTTAQSARMWAMLGDVSRCVVWHGRKLSAEEWKHVFSAALKRQDVVPGIDGGFVVLGQSTSSMSVREMSELIDLIDAFGTQQGVEWSDEKQPSANPSAFTA